MAFESVYVTFPDVDTAKRTAKDVVGRRLAACANLWPIESVYRWQGEVEEEAEVAGMFKTSRDRVAELMAALAEAHPYDTPCIVGFAHASGLPAYRDWMEDETQPANTE